MPVKWETLSAEQKKHINISHMFLKEKFNNGVFEKLKVGFVADGRMQDRSIHSNYSSPTAKTSSIFPCLKIGATMG